MRQSGQKAEVSGKASGLSWVSQLARLKLHRRKQGDCGVPHRWVEEPPLSEWVAKQRLYKIALDRGEPNPKITPMRVAKLAKLGFAWAGTARMAPASRPAQLAIGAAGDTAEQQQGLGEPNNLVRASRSSPTMCLEISAPLFGSFTGNIQSFPGGRCQKLTTHRTPALERRCG
jgi:hypothetical protein